MAHADTDLHRHSHERRLRIGPGNIKAVRRYLRVDKQEVELFQHRCDMISRYMELF